MKCLHRFTLSGSITTDSKRIFTLRCNLCGKEKTRRKALGRVGKAPSTAHPQKKPGSLKTQKKPISRVSERRKVEEKEYSKLRKVFLEENPKCQICQQEPATEVHHRSGRYHGKYLDVSSWMALGSACHRRVHENPAWAKAQKYIIPIYS